MTSCLGKKFNLWNYDYSSLYQTVYALHVFRFFALRTATSYRPKAAADFKHMPCLQKISFRTYQLPGLLLKKFSSTSAKKWNFIFVLRTFEKAVSMI